MNRVLALIFVPLMSLALLSGCATSPPGVPVTSAIIDRPGVIITAEDNSFRLESGKEFVPPIQGDCRFAANDIERASFGERYVGFTWGMSVKVEDYPLAKKHCSGKSVRVTVPGKKIPLYGFLVMNKIAAGAPALAATRSYLIDVPDAYVDAVSGGRVSVVYESWHTGERQIPTWVLWLSDRPLP